MSFDERPSSQPELRLADLPVSEISGSFFVPAYQRGYRWGRLEVRQLLDDVTASEGKRYYLQPIVVKRMPDGRLELIDGQQRLTTLHLMLADEAAQVLGIPSNITQAALLPVAYTLGDDFKPANRPPASEITYWDTWGEG